MVCGFLYYQYPFSSCSSIHHFFYLFIYLALLFVLMWSQKVFCPLHLLLLNLSTSSGGHSSFTTQSRNHERSMQNCSVIDCMIEILTIFFFIIFSFGKNLIFLVTCITQYKFVLQCRSRRNSLQLSSLTVEM